jgi:hypothetical protein
MITNIIQNLENKEPFKTYKNKNKFIKNKEFLKSL